MKKIESGRSMVEMLGVLAIIGVLSIGGIAGYTMAMNRYRANEIIDAASKVIVVAQTRTGTTLTANLEDIGLEGTSVGGCATEIVATSTPASTTEAGKVVITSTCSDGVKKVFNSTVGTDSKIGNFTTSFGA